MENGRIMACSMVQHYDLGQVLFQPVFPQISAAEQMVEEDARQRKGDLCKHPKAVVARGGAGILDSVNGHSSS